jgi:hypothetical protein
MTRNTQKIVRFRIKHGRFICTANYIKRAGHKKKEIEERKALHRWEWRLLEKLELHKRNMSFCNVLEHYSSLD